MKAMISKVLAGAIGLVAIASAAPAMADDIQLGQPSWGGTGCPSNTVGVSLSPDQKALSILFDQYVVDVGGTSPKRSDYKTCNLSIPVKVPQGYSVSIFQVDYRGFNNLPWGASSTFTAEYFFAGARGPRQSTNFRGPLTEPYTLTDMLQAEAVAWTPCGAMTNLRVNTSMFTQTNSARQQAMSTVDSADITAGLVYHIAWRRCQ